MAYAETTKVPFDRSINEIVALVRKAGAEQIGQIEDSDFFAIQFRLSERMIRFRIPMPDWNDIPQRDGNRRTLTKEKREEKHAQAKRQRGRALMLVIKAKLESVESGVETMEEAFLANVVMSDGATVYERISGPIALEYREGRPSATSGLLTSPKEN